MCRDRIFTVSGNDTPIVRLMEYLQDQTNEQLRLREPLRTELVAVGRQCPLGDGVSRQGNGLG